MTTTTGLSEAPRGYTTVTPWIVLRGVADFIPFLERAFDAQELARVPEDDGSIGHAEVRIGDSVVMMFDARADWPATPAFLRLYVADAEATHERALTAGGHSVTEVTDLFFGDRVGRVRDPWGNIWWIQERLREVEVGDMGRLAAEPGHIEAMRYAQDTLVAAMSEGAR